MNRPRFTPLAIALLASCTSSCAVGPDFHRPEAPAVTGYAPSPPPTAYGSGTDAQPLAWGADVSPNWWHAFGSAEIDAAVQRALARNPDLAAAEAALRVAQQLAAAQHGAFWPAVAAGWNSTRERTPDPVSPVLSSADNPFMLHTAQVTISYALDVFGGQRRAAEAADAAAEMQRDLTDAARTALAANVVVAVVREAALHADADAAERSVQLQQELVALTTRQRDLGAVSNAAVATQQTALAQSQAALVQIRRQWLQSRDALLALEGSFPDEAPAASINLGSLALPALPVAIPSALLERRPDIRAAEANCHAASAAIGVATANMLPQLTLSGGLGQVAERAGQLFASGNRGWTVAGDLQQPVFAGGRLWHQRGAARAAFEQALAAYRSTVVAAFQNVADTLNALDGDAAALAAARAAEEAARRTAVLAARQVELGDLSRAGQIPAELALLGATAARQQALADRYADTAALYAAIGGASP